LFPGYAVGPPLLSDRPRQGRDKEERTVSFTICRNRPMMKASGYRQAVTLRGRKVHAGTCKAFHPALPSGGTTMHTVKVPIPRAVYSQDTQPVPALSRNAGYGSGQSLKKDFASGLTKKAVDELFLMVFLAYLGNLRWVHGSEPG